MIFRRSIFVVFRVIVYLVSRLLGYSAEDGVVGKILGKYKDGSDFKITVRRSTKIVNIDDDLVMLDLSSVKNAESLEFIFYNGDFLEDVILSTFDNCSALSSLKLRIKKDIDLSPLQNVNNYIFNLKLDCYKETDLSTLSDVNIHLLTLNYYAPVQDPLKTILKDASFQQLYLKVLSESCVKLDNVSKDIMLLSISGPLSELDLSSLEDAKNLRILKLDELNVPNMTLSDFSKNSLFYRDDNFQQIRIPKSVAVRLHCFSLTNCYFESFFSYPFSGSTCLRSIDFNGSNWNNMYFDDFCDISSLIEISLDTNMRVYLEPEYVIGEKEIISPAMNQFQANIGFDSY